MKPHSGTITQWAIVMHAPYGYVAIGLADEQYIRTSPIVKMEKTETGFDIETENSRYELRGPIDDAGGRALYRARAGREPGERRA